MPIGHDQLIDDSFNIKLLYVFKGNLGTWRRKKLNVVARSIAKAKYRGIALGTTEMLWLWNILRDLGYGPKEAMKLYCDTKAVCEIATNLVHHGRTKHVRVDLFVIKEKLDRRIIDIPRVNLKISLHMS